MPFRPSQSGFRGRGDTVGLNVNTWTYNLNTGWTQAVDSTFRVRILVQEVGAVAGADTYKLRASLNGGTYQDVTSSSTIVKLVLSGQYADLDATSALLGGTGTFAAGAGLESSTSTGSISLAASGNTEVEFCCQIVSANVANNDTVTLRIYRGTNTAMYSYGQTPSLTVSKVTIKDLGGGTAAGASTVSGTLTAAHPLRASVAGASTVSGTLQKTRLLQSTIGGSTAVTGTLARTLNLGASSTGAATVSSTLGTSRPAGARSLLAFWVGGGGSKGAGAVALAGQASCAATISASLGIVRKLAATTAGAATVSGTLKRSVQLGGTANGAASVSATRLAVASSLRATVTGAASVSASRMVATKPLRSTVNGAATVSGTMPAAGVKLLSGTAAGSSTVSGTLKRTAALRVTISGSAAVPIARVSVSRKLGSVSAGAAAVSGTLRTARPLAARSNGASTVSGTLGVKRALRATVAGSATVSASMQAGGWIGRSSGASVVSGTLSRTAAFRGVSTGVSSVQGTGRLVRPFRASCGGSTTAGAALAAGINLGGQSVGTGSGAYALGIGRALAATINGAATATGTLEQFIYGHSLIVAQISAMDDVTERGAYGDGSDSRTGGGVLVGATKGGGEA